MKLIGLEVLENFRRGHADIRNPLDAWEAEARDAQWTTPQDIKARYASASFIGDDRVVFNIKGTKYRLDVKVNYRHQIVLVKRIGTHEEYNKWTF